MVSGGGGYGAGGGAGGRLVGARGGGLVRLLGGEGGGGLLAEGGEEGGEEEGALGRHGCLCLGCRHKERFESLDPLPSSFPFLFLGVLNSFAP